MFSGGSYGGDGNRAVRGRLDTIVGRFDFVFIIATAGHFIRILFLAIYDLFLYWTIHIFGSSVAASTIAFMTRILSFSRIVEASGAVA